MNKERHSCGYWTYERCKEEAKKYKTRTEFNIKAVGAYTSALKHSWLDDICKHMIMKWEKKWASKEACSKEAVKYKTRTEFQEKSNGAYTYAMRHGFLEEICEGMTLLWKSIWDKEKCTIEAQKYNRRIDFQRGSNSAYTYAMRHGFLDEICQHMKFYYQTDTYKTDKIRADFVREHLQISVEEWKEIFQTFLSECKGSYKSNRIMKKRCIYAAEFSDDYVYIGLAENLRSRIKQHVSKPNSRVFEHMEQTGLSPVFKKVRDFAPETEAQKNEGEVEQNYKNNGWKILNRAKTGALGGTSLYWNKERCLTVASKCPTKSYFISEFSGAYASSLRNGWIEEVTSIIVTNEFNSWSDEQIVEEARKYGSRMEFKKNSQFVYSMAFARDLMVVACANMIKPINAKKWTYETLSLETKKYNTKKDLRKNASGAYSAAQKLGILNQICTHMEYPIVSHNKKWTELKLKEEAKTYKTKKEFKENASGAYSVATRMGILNMICSHMVKPISKGTYWTKERCRERALLYHTRMEFKKNDGSAYTTAVRERWLDEICQHMKHPSPKIKWTKDACHQEALKYITRKEFRKQSASAYTTAVYRGWISDICTHMITLRKREHR